MSHETPTSLGALQEGGNLYSESEQCQADVVVGAFGLDDGGCKLFERMTEGISALYASLPADARLQAILKDLVCGRIIRKLAIASARYGFLDSVIDLARKEPLLCRALFGCVSAHQRYRDIVWATLQPALALKLTGDGDGAADATSEPTSTEIGNPRRGPIGPRC